MKDVFISFSSKQTNEAMHICEFIEKHGFNCFIATRDLIPGEEYAAQLLQNIDESKAVVFILTKDSNTSVQCLREIEYAVRSNTPILVYPLEQVKLERSLEYFLMTHQWITDYGNKEDNLISSIDRIVKRNAEICSEKAQNYRDVNNVEQAKAKTSPSPKLKIATIIACTTLLLILVIAIVFLSFINKQNDPSTDYASHNDKEQTTDDGDEDNAKEKDIKESDIQNTNYNVGDTVVFGHYLDEPITWRVIKVCDDGTMYLISEHILSMKVFDAAEGGEYNNYDGVDYWSFENHIIDDNELCVLVRGSNEWKSSNIRTWLNSSDEVVKYEDQAPTHKAVDHNSYSNEPGFLYNFTKDEQNSLVEITHDTKKDKVFLLSSGELDWMKDAGISIYAVPTDSCLANNDEKDVYESFSSTYRTKTYYWWLRDSSSEKANEANAVCSEYEDIEIITSSVGATNFGVRPVVCVNIDSDVIEKVK